MILFSAPPPPRCPVSTWFVYGPFPFLQEVRQQIKIIPYQTTTPATIQTSEETTKIIFDETSQNVMSEYGSTTTIILITTIICALLLISGFGVIIYRRGYIWRLNHSR